MNLVSWLKIGEENEHPRHLVLPLELEDGGRTYAYRRLLTATTIGFFVILTWGSMTPIRELAIAPGQILPDNQPRSLQHLEGGIIAEIMAHEGEVVEKDQILLKLEPAPSQSDLSMLKVRAASLRFQRDRLDALLAGNSPDFGLLGTINPNLAADQQSVFEARSDWRVSERRTLLARIDQRKAEIRSTTNEIEGLKRLTDIQEEQLSIRDSLLKQGYTSRKAYLETKAVLEQAKSQLNASEGRLAASKQALAEAEGQLATGEADARKTWAEEASKTAAELAEVEEGLRKQEDKVDRLALRSPVQGIIQQIAPRSTGEVIKPGDTVVRIIPLSDALVAEVQIRPDDIGHIRIGDQAMLKVTTFDSSIYGSLSGKVSAISASTFPRENNGEAYYKGTIVLERQSLGDRGNPKRLLPGMVVNAEIVTGAKSLVRYLLRPLYKNYGAAFSEH